MRASAFGARCAPFTAMVAALALTLVTIAGTAVGAAEAAETLKLAVGAPGNWDTCIPAVGERAGIFRNHGIELELLYTNGGGETMQAVISGSVDIGIAAGTGAVMGAFAKGAPVRIIAAGVTGASDLYWYVPAGFADPTRSRTPPARPSPIRPTAPRPTSRCSRSSSISTSRRGRSRPAPPR